MEERLKVLIQGGLAANRAKWALDWKAQGKPVVGVLCSHVPEEVIYAAGMLPWRVLGTRDENVASALVYREARSCMCCTHVLESVLRGDLDFLDGAVATNRDQDLVRMYDVWQITGHTPFYGFLHVPYSDGRLAEEYFSREMRKLAGVLEAHGGAPVTPESLRHAIDVHNRMRTLLRAAYELRKRDEPALSGAEALGLALAATAMPKDPFNSELEALLPYLEQRKTPLTGSGPRLLVSSELMDDPSYLEVIEGTGAAVVMDDLDIASRYFWEPVKTDEGDAYDALARRYLYGPAGPRMWWWHRMADQVVDWVRDFRADGVVLMTQIYCRPSEMWTPFLMSRLKEAGIPAISTVREYTLTNVGQLRTRMEAFVETLAGVS